MSGGFCGVTGQGQALRRPGLVQYNCEFTTLHPSRPPITVNHVTESAEAVQPRPLRRRPHNNRHSPELVEMPAPRTSPALSCHLPPVALTSQLAAANSTRLLALADKGWAPRRHRRRTPPRHTEQRLRAPVTAFPAPFQTLRHTRSDIGSLI